VHLGQCCQAVCEVAEQDVLRDVVIAALSIRRRARRDRYRRMLDLLLGQKIRERAPNARSVDGELNPSPDSRARQDRSDGFGDRRV